MAKVNPVQVQKDLKGVELSSQSQSASGSPSYSEYHPLDG